MKARDTKKAVGAVALALTATLAAGCGPTPPSADTRPLTVPAARADWIFGAARGAVVTTEHYRVHTTTANRLMEQYLPGFLEAAHAQYARLTGLAAIPTAAPTRGPGGQSDTASAVPGQPAEPMTVYMFGSRDQWATMTRRLTGPRSPVYLSIENGGYCYRGVGVFWDMGHFATLSIAAHEGLHQFLHFRLVDPIPAWAEEGLAVMAEGYHMNWSDRSVRFDPEANTLRLSSLREQIVGGRWIPLERLLSTDAADYVTIERTGPEYYAQLWALLLQVRSVPTYRDGLAAMLTDAADGSLRRKLRAPTEMGAGRAYNRSVSIPVFQHYIDSDLAAFEKAFRAHAMKLAHLD